MKSGLSNKIKIKTRASNKINITKQLNCNNEIIIWTNNKIDFLKKLVFFK